MWDWRLYRVAIAATVSQKTHDIQRTHSLHLARTETDPEKYLSNQKRKGFLSGIFIK